MNMRVQKLKDRSYSASDLKNPAGLKPKSNRDTSFSSSPQALYEVKKLGTIEKILPAVAFFCSLITTVGYLVGGIGLFYDSNHEKKSGKKNSVNTVDNKKPIMAASTQFAKYNSEFIPVGFEQVSKPTVSNQSKNNEKKTKDEEEGVKTIKASTKFGKVALNCGRVAVTSSALSGVTCGLGEGIPAMALGESTNLAAASIIETPIGTGLFGIGIASIFSGLALDNTPHLKLNMLHYKAEKDFSKKMKMVMDNTKATFREIFTSMAQVVKNIYKPSFLKENFLQGTPKTVVFTERINKDGKVFLSKALRHNKNYMMHAASFTLGLGGLSLIITSLLDQKKAQKASLVTEEGGFLFDNLGMTRMGLDKLTTNGKTAGSGYAIGGIINAISQFMGLDNKEGRATQWLGISLVFFGFSIDRGKHFFSFIKNYKHRGELTDAVREWKLDLSKLFNAQELKLLKKQIKSQSNSNPITNQRFNNIEKALNDVIKDKYRSKEEIVKALEKVDKQAAENIEHNQIFDYEKSKEILKSCTKEIFGSETPEPVKQAVK